MAGQLLSAGLNFGCVKALGKWAGGGGVPGGARGGRYRQRSERHGRRSSAGDDPLLGKSSAGAGQGRWSEGRSERIHAAERHANSMAMASG